MINFVRSIFSCALAALAHLSPNLQAQISPPQLDWPQWRGPNRNGISAETNWTSNWPREGPSILWKTNVGAGYATVSISDGKLYTVGRINENDMIFCLEAGSGKKIWNHAYPAGKYAQRPAGDVGPGSTPTIVGERLYALGLGGEFFCIQASNGEVHWKKNLMNEFGVKPPPYGFTSAPLAWKKMVIVDVGRVVAFNLENGELIWKTEDYGASYASPILINYGGEECLVSFNATGLVILQLFEGLERFREDWSFTGINNVNASTPVISGDKVFVASGYESGWGLIELKHLRKPAIIWRKQHEWHLFSSPVLIDGNVYIFNATLLQCLDFNSGELKWSRESLGNGSLMAAAGKLLT